MDNLITLNLKYYLESIESNLLKSVSLTKVQIWLNKNITPWFETMKNDYVQFFQAVLDEEVGKGLDSNALQLAMQNSNIGIDDFLLELGATKD